MRVNLLSLGMLLAVIGGMAACGGSKFGGSKSKPADEAEKKPENASKPAAKVNTDNGTKGAETTPKTSDVVTSVAVAPGPACPKDLYKSISRIAVKRGAQFNLPASDGPTGRPLKYVAAKPLPAGASLTGTVFSVAPNAPANSTQANLQVSLATGECLADIVFDIPGANVNISTTPLSRGARGVLYAAPWNGNTALFPLVPNIDMKMPDFEKMTPMARDNIFFPSIEILCDHNGDRSCNGRDGFIVEGYRDLRENFGIRITNFLVVEEEGLYAFQSYSDDGSSVRLLDGPGLAAPIYVVLNGNPHTPRHSEGAPILLKKGLYNMVTDYYQQQIGNFVLQVNWKKPGARDFVPIPGEALLVQ